jgi:hypothetical protein
LCARAEMEISAQTGRPSNWIPFVIVSVCLKANYQLTPREPFPALRIPRQQCRLVNSKK